ncbi:DUF3226 domain-containing protein [Flavobacterium olei]|uniref:DUF3226 domain-containing protein n=1 Tax=Flavobacterium olei TaxID=1886782 RepID=UPI00321A32F4
MAVQIIAILCEGPHDVEFIARILKHNGYSSNDKLKIKDFPTPINDLLRTEASKTNVEDLNLQEVRQVLLPSSSLKINSNFYLLYTMGGDSKKDIRKQLLNDFYSLIPNENEISSLPEGTSLGVLYFLDADDKGVVTRISELNDEIFEVLNIKPFTNHKEVFNHLGLKLGSFIFTGIDNEKGKLEDVLMPLMIEGNEQIFDNANNYLVGHYDDKRKAQKYDKEKSTIGVVGQLQISGSSNTVCIKKSDYITEAKIKASDKCVEIFDYINSFN